SAGRGRCTSRVRTQEAIMGPFARAGAPLDCPSRDALVEFDRGRLSDPDYEAVAEHISSCSWCADVLEALHNQTTDDSLVADLKECFRDHPLPDGRSRPGAEELAATATISAQNPQDPVSPPGR